MSRLCLTLVAIACLHQAATKPIRRTLNFNMFVLQPKQGDSQEESSPDRVLFTTDGVSRFGPLLEYIVQRIQGMMSVRRPPEPQYETDVIPDTAENEVDGVRKSRTPNIVVRPSQTKPGTYEVEIDVVVDDGQPDERRPDKA